MLTKLKKFKWLEQPGFNFFIFVLILLVLRIFFRNQMLELDEAEQVAMAQELFAGYPAQPPLYSWLQYGIFQLLGINLLSLAFLKSVLIFGSLYLYHQICRFHCQSLTLAWCATVSWALIPVISLTLVKDGTHSILALFSACLTWYWLILSTRITNFSWYLIFGLIIALGLLSKFNYLVFLGILFLSATTLNEYRYKLLNYKFILTLAISGLVVSPYFFWLIAHLDLGFRNAYKLMPADKEFSSGLLRLIKVIVLFIGPSFIVSRLVFPSKFKSTQSSLINLLLVRYNLICIPLLIIMVLTTGIKNFEARWLIPILFLYPLLYFSQLKEAINFTLRIKFFISFCLVIQLCCLTTLMQTSPHQLSKQFTLKQITKNFETRIARVDFILSDSHWLLGNLKLIFPGVNTKLLVMNNSLSLPSGKSLIIWQSASSSFWLTYFATTENLQQINYIQDPKTLQTLAAYTYADKDNNS
ncbi:MAG: glycosyltransferase family 39 protein [Tatlockia sp.]|nr:glycosyltransferase family 39 protein [Tatlockia sp.]